MNKIFLPIFSIIILILSSCNNEDYTSPKKYYDDIETHYYKVMDIKDSLDILINANELNESAIDSVFILANDECETAIEEVTDMGSFEDNDTMQLAAIELFKEIKDVVNTDYKNLYELFKKPPQNWSDADVDKMYNYFDNINDRIYKKDDIFYKSQLNFSTKYNIDMF